MFGWFSDGPRTWKWAVPGLLAMCLGFWGSKLSMLSGERDLGVFMMILAMFLGMMAVTNWWKLVSAHSTEMYVMRRGAESETPLVLLSKNMKQMHPEAIKVLNRFGVKTSWGVKVNVERGERDWVLLDTDPSVHFGFIEYVLDNSKGGKLMPMGYPYLTDGSKKWDPDGLIEDREQYHSLRKWMFARMMITEAHGNQPPHFLPPWNAELLMESMGLTGEQDLYKPELDEKRTDMTEIPASKSVMDMLPKNSSVPKGDAISSQQSMVRQRRDEISDEEWNAIQKEMAEYGNKFEGGVVPN